MILFKIVLRTGASLSNGKSDVLHELKPCFLDPEILRILAFSTDSDRADVSDWQTCMEPESFVRGPAPVQLRHFLFVFLRGERRSKQIPL